MSSRRKRRRAFADWQENKPGFLEVDLVAHCGESTEGFYLTTLCAVDVATGWAECPSAEGWGKGQSFTSEGWQCCPPGMAALTFPLAQFGLG